MKKILLFTLITIITLLPTDFFAQKKEKEQPLVDTRIDNMGYWKKMVKKGLVSVHPIIKPPKAIRKSSKINARGIQADSPDIPVSDTGTDTQSETSIFVNPTDNGKVLNSNNSTSWNGSSIGTLLGSSYLLSDDFGLTWGGSVNAAGGSNSGDPSAVINLNGRQYIGFIHSNRGQGVSYSDDGVSWTSVVAGPPTGGSVLDKNHLWIDNSPTSSFEGNLYDAWTDFNTDDDIYIVKSNDDGLTYSSPINLSSPVNALSHNQGVNIQTASNGDVYVVWSIYDGWPTDETAIGFAKSTDGGVSYSTGERIITTIRGIRTSATSKNQRVNSFPSMAVDISGGTNDGNIYIVWANVGVPGTNTGTNRSIYMAKSTNGGSTWATPIRVNQGTFQEGKEAYFPWITSDPETGVLSVIFYDDRDVSSTQVETWVANSYDGGDTWEDFRVSDVAFTPSPIPGLAGGYMGDYLGISARGGVVYPVWPDNRNGYLQTWVSPFTIDSNPVEEDIIVSIDGPTTVSLGEEINVTVNYKASTNRKVKLELKVGDNSYFAYGQYRNVTAGTETETYTFTVPNDAPLGSNYKYVAFITTATGGWSDRLDYKTKSVSVVGSSTSDLLGHWPFNGNTNDVSGNNHHATAQNSPSYSTGQVGQGMNTNGSYAKVASDPFDLSTFTLMTWVKPSNVSSGWRVIMEKDRFKSDWYGIYQKGNKIHFRWSSNFTTGTMTTSAAVLQTNTFAHVAVTFSNGTAKIYINGELKGTKQGVLGAASSSDGELRFGLNGSGNEKFQGVLDEAKIFGTALTVVEIQGEIGDTTPPTNPSNLVATDTTETTTFLNWVASTDNVGVIGYDIFYAGDINIGTVPNSNSPIEGLVAGNTYIFKVRAIDDAGKHQSLVIPLR